MSKPRLVFAANRRVGLEALRALAAADWTPELLLLAKGANADHADEMQAVFPHVPVIRGRSFRERDGIAAIRRVQPEYLVSVHFPYIVPRAVLDAPTIGALNLHPAYLPYNRGWHTPSWAILEQTKYGCTLHWMDEGVDTGDIALQRELQVRADDTAHSLYQRVLADEVELFKEALPQMMARTLPRIQQVGEGTAHSKKDLCGVQKLALDETHTTREFLNRLRALATNDPDETAYFETPEGAFAVRVEIARRGEPS